VYESDHAQTTEDRPRAHELKIVREVAAMLLGETEDIADEMAVRLHTVIPELAAERGGPFMSQTRLSCRSNVGQILRALARGEPVDTVAAPPEAIEYAHSYVKRDLPLVVLLRAYRVGQAHFLERWTPAMARHAAPDPGLGTALAASIDGVFAYVDKVCNEMVAEYRAARERWVRTPDAARAEAVRAILDGTLCDPREAGRYLGHELVRRQHLAVVMWESGRDHARGHHVLERAASAVTEALGTRDPLLLPGGFELWGWFSGLSKHVSAPAPALASIDWPAGVRLATGRVRTGIAGFRQSHLEARAAAAVAVLAGPAAAAVTHYDDVELVSLLSVDLDRARAFVSYELDGLAGRDRVGARLRETILVLLEEGMSNSRAAQRLHVHPNTVAYRTARAQELLGRRLVNRRVQVTAALMLARTLGDAVLKDAGAHAT
jgi:hypothetical protein